MDYLVFGVLLGGVMASFPITADIGFKKFRGFCFDKQYLRAFAVFWGLGLTLLAYVIIPLMAQFTSDDPETALYVVMIACSSFVALIYLYCWLRKEPKRIRGNGS